MIPGAAGRHIDPRDQRSVGGRGVGGDPAGGGQAVEQLALALIAPTLLVLFALTIFPFVYAIYVSLFDFYLPRPQQSSFVGLGNFAGVLADPRFWVSMKQTGYFLTSAIAAEFVIGMALALFFFEESRGRSLKAVYLPLILVPMMVAPVVIGYMWRLLYQVEFGPINYLLFEVFGLGPFEWTSSPQTALLSVIIADVWQWTPFVTLVLLAGLVSLPQELFEVAQLDGASYWQRLRYVILPMLRRVIAIRASDPPARRVARARQDLRHDPGRPGHRDRDRLLLRLSLRLQVLPGRLRGGDVDPVAADHGGDLHRDRQGPVQGSRARAERCRSSKEPSATPCWP